jgi:hypothetical protein
MGEANPIILFLDRADDKNRQGIIDLKIKSFLDCIPYIKSLTCEQFSHALESDDAQEKAEERHLWVFGVLVGKKQRPAYVKVQLGRGLGEPICISFHPPEFRMNFPFPSQHSIIFQTNYDAQSKNR